VQPDFGVNRRAVIALSILRAAPIAPVTQRTAKYTKFSAKPAPILLQFCTTVSKGAAVFGCALSADMLAVGTVFVARVDWDPAGSMLSVAPRGGPPLGCMFLPKSLSQTPLSLSVSITVPDTWIAIVPTQFSDQRAYSADQISRVVVVCPFR
jgi:hypothetical protein